MEDRFARTKDSFNYINTITTNSDIPHENYQELTENHFINQSKLGTSNLQNIEQNIQRGDLTSNKASSITGRYDAASDFNFPKLDKQQTLNSPLCQDIDVSFKNDVSDQKDFFTEVENGKSINFESSYNRWKESFKLRFVETALTKFKKPTHQVISTSCSDLEVTNLKKNKYVPKSLHGGNRCTDEGNNLQGNDSVQSKSYLKENTALLSCVVCNNYYATNCICLLTSAHDRENYTCSFCNKNFSHSYFEEDHGMDVPKTRLFECCVCSSWFDEASKLAKHKNSHYVVVKYLPSCLICSQNFIIEHAFFPNE